MASNNNATKKKCIWICQHSNGTVSYNSSLRKARACLSRTFNTYGCWWSGEVHGDVIKRKHYPRYWPFVQGIHQWPVNSPHKWPVTRKMFHGQCINITDFYSPGSKPAEKYRFVDLCEGCLMGLLGLRPSKLCIRGGPEFTFFGLFLRGFLTTFWHKWQRQPHNFGIKWKLGISNTQNSTQKCCSFWFLFRCKFSKWLRYGHF